MCFQGYWTKRDNNSEKQSTVCLRFLCQTITNSLSSMYKLCVDPLCRAFLYRGLSFSFFLLHVLVLLLAMIIFRIKLVFFVSRVYHHSCREPYVLALIYLRLQGKHTNTVWASSLIIIALRSLCLFNLLQNLVCKKRKAHFCFVSFSVSYLHTALFLCIRMCVLKVVYK